MNKRQNQSGSAHLVVIIILSVALLGSLGFVFYQNFVLTKSGQAVPMPTAVDKKTIESIEKETVSEIALTEVASDQSRGTGFSIKYPKTWTIEHAKATDETSQSDASSDISTITSPDSKINVTLRVGISGIGGTCDLNDTNSKLLKINTDAMPNYSGSRFASYVSYDRVSGYQYYINAQYDNDMTKGAVVGGSPCKLYMAELLNRVEGGPIITVQAAFTDMPNHNAPSLEEFDKATATDNYKIAKRIIQSLYVKE